MLTFPRWNQKSIGQKCILTPNDFILLTNNRMIWYKNNLIHRNHGPAIINSFGYYYYQFGMKEHTEVSGLQKHCFCFFECAIQNLNCYITIILRELPPTKITKYHNIDWFNDYVFFAFLERWYIKEFTNSIYSM